MNQVGKFCSVCLLMLFAIAVAADEPTDAGSTTPLEAETLAKVDQAKALFAAALQSSGKQRVDGLRRSYQQLVEAAGAEPVLPPARTMWAKMLLSVGDQRSAQASLQQAITEHPGDPEAFVLIASQAVRHNQLAEAALAYQQAERLAAGWSSDHARRAGILGRTSSGLATVAQARAQISRQRQLPELAAEYDRTALEHLQRWVEVAPTSAVAHDRLAAALLKDGQLETAVATFDRARTLNPNLPVTDLRLAQSQLASGDLAAAQENLRRAVETSPDDLSVRTTAADLWLVIGELESAEVQINAALEIDSDDLVAQRLHAQLLRFRGQWQAACDALQQLSNQHPTDFETANLLALTLTELATEADRQRALEVATVTAQRFDANSSEGRRARVSLVWAAHSAGQPQAAKQALNQLLSAGIESNRISGDEGYFLSRLLVDFGRPELAATMLTSVLSRVGAFPKRVAAEGLAAQLK